MSTNAVISELQTSWGLLFPETPAPSTRQFALWITAYGTQSVRSAIVKLASREKRPRGENLYRFADVLMGGLRHKADTRHVQDPFDSMIANGGANEHRNF